MGIQGDLWVIGAQNAGKSSLINALRYRAGTAAATAALTTAPLPGTTLDVVPVDGLPLLARSRCYDTPGVPHPHQLTARFGGAPPLQSPAAAVPGVALRLQRSWNLFCVAVLGFVIARSQAMLVADHLQGPAVCCVRYDLACHAPAPWANKLNMRKPLNIASCALRPLTCL